MRQGREAGRQGERKGEREEKRVRKREVEVERNINRSEGIELQNYASFPCIFFSLALSFSLSCTVNVFFNYYY